MKKKTSFKNLDKHGKINVVLYILVTASMAFPIIYLVIRLATGNLSASQETGANSMSSYVLMIVECVLGLLVINVPSIIARRFRFELPVILYSMFIIFLYCAIFLGEVQNFYYIIPFWDVILHGFSSLMLGFFGMMVISILNHNEDIVFHLSPVFVVVFAFCFAVSFNTIWEIYEFSVDSIMGLNMQKYITADGTVLVGHAALVDTMKDIIVDVIGAALASVIGYFSIKNNRYWFIPHLTNE